MRFQLALVGLLAAGAAFAQTPATPFDGKWNAQVVRPAPNPPQDLVINLATDKGGKVTGVLTIVGTGDSPIAWGFVKGDLITFRVTVPGAAAPTPFVYVGRFDGTKVDFGRRPDDLSVGQLVEFSATKAK